MACPQYAAAASQHGTSPSHRLVLILIYKPTPCSTLQLLTNQSSDPGGTLVVALHPHAHAAAFSNQYTVRIHYKATTKVGATSNSGKCLCMTFVSNFAGWRGNTLANAVVVGGCRREPLAFKESLKSRRCIGFCAENNMPGGWTMAANPLGTPH